MMNACVYVDYFVLDSDFIAEKIFLPAICLGRGWSIDSMAFPFFSKYFVIN